MNIKAPQFLTDVYRDLRDRRLLIPALALLVALIAVPVLLHKPAEPVAAAPAAAAPSADATAVTSAVLVDSTVPVREYERRLAKLKSKNPFEANIKISNGGSGNGGGGDGTSTDTGSTVPTSPDTTAPSGSSTDTTPTSPTTTPTDTSTPSDTTTTPTQPEIRFFAGRVDVTVGPIGKGKDIDNVKYLTFLPDDATPIAAFVGLTGSGRSESAVFAITALAEVGDGEGTCAPHKPDPCQFLTLKPGESRYIKYGNKTYRLKVRDTHIVSIPDPRDQSAGNDGSANNGGNGSGDGNGSTGGTQP